MVDLNSPERAHGESYYGVADKFRNFFDSNTENKIDLRKDVFGIPFILQNWPRNKDLSGANQYWTIRAGRPEYTSYSTSVSSEIGLFMEREFDFDSVYEGLPEVFQSKIEGYGSLAGFGGTVRQLINEVAGADNVFVTLNGKNIKKISEATGEQPILPEPIVWATKSYFGDREKPLIIHLMQADRLATTEVRPDLWRKRFSHRPSDQAEVAEYLRKPTETSSSPLFSYTEQLLRHEMTHPIVEQILYRFRKMGEVPPEIRYKLVELFVIGLEPVADSRLNNLWQTIEAEGEFSNITSWATDKTKTDTLLLRETRQENRKKIFWEMITRHKDSFCELIRNAADRNKQGSQFNFDPNEIINYIYDDKEPTVDEKIRASLLVLFAPTGNNLEKDMDKAFPSWRQYL